MCMLNTRHLKYNVICPVYSSVQSTLHSKSVVSATAAVAGDIDNDQRIDGILSKIRSPGRRLLVDDLSDAERYTLGATALDCSLMVTFRRAAAAHVDR